MDSADSAPMTGAAPDWYIARVPNRGPTRAAPLSMTTLADEPKSCVKCGYVRQPADSAPDYECPRCGVVYAKAEAARRAQERARDIEARRVIAGERRTPPLERPEPAVPDPERDADLPRLGAHLVYLLYAIPIGVTALAGVIVAYSMRARQRGTWLASHYTWQIRTFWYLAPIVLPALAAALVTIVAIPVYVASRKSQYAGLVLLGLLTVIVLGTIAVVVLAWRVIRGWYRLSQGKAP
jgi:uncharacterized membrane protein/predicted RNA-binding Zn-ribbon protein involved in translation (DUF1610 family)